jgi:hypothetical protein
MDQTVIVRSQFSREEVLAALRAQHPWIPPNGEVSLEAESASVKNCSISNVGQLVVEYTKKGAFLLSLVVLCVAGCAAPNSAWVAGGYRSTELGVTAPTVLGAFQVEASVERRAYDVEQSRGGHMRPAGLQGGGSGRRLEGRAYETQSEDHYLGRAGLRWSPLDWAHLAAGLTEELGAYARVGLERRLTENCSIGVDVVSDRGEVALFGISWRR